jgi:hypothetical protein
LEAKIGIVVVHSMARWAGCNVFLPDSQILLSGLVVIFAVTQRITGDADRDEAALAEAIS